MILAGAASLHFCNLFGWPENHRRHVEAFHLSQNVFIYSPGAEG